MLKTKKLRWWSKCLLKIYDFLTFDFYIIFFLEQFLMMVINAGIEVTSVFDQKFRDNHSEFWPFSLTFSIIFLISFMLFIALQFCYVDRKRSKDRYKKIIDEKETQNQHQVLAMYKSIQKFSSFYDGLRPIDHRKQYSQYYQIFHMMFVIRRCYVALIIIAFRACNSQLCSRIQSSGMIGLQFMFLLYVCAVHSFTGITNNISTIVNEIILLLLLLIIFTLPYKDGAGENLWISYSNKEKYMSGLVLYGTLVTAMIIIVETVLKIIKSVWKLSTKCLDGTNDDSKVHAKDRVERIQNDGNSDISHNSNF